MGTHTNGFGDKVKYLWNTFWSPGADTEPEYDDYDDRDDYSTQVDSPKWERMGTEREPVRVTEYSFNRENRERESHRGLHDNSFEKHDEGLRMPSRGDSRGSSSSTNTVRPGKFRGYESYRDALVMKFAPKTIEDALLISKYVNEGKICTVVVSGLERGLAQRMMDIISGVVHVNDGDIVVDLTDNVYTFTAERGLVLSHISDEGESTAGSASFLSNNPRR